MDLKPVTGNLLGLGPESDPALRPRSSANGNGRANADSALIRAIQGGLPPVERPFAAIAAELGWTEEAVIERIRALQAQGAIKRLGVVVRHQELGYGANAMVVWDLPDARVDALGRRIGALPFVTLCYRRPRRPPAWPYNLFTMIHGRDRAAVLTQVARLKADLEAEWGPLANEVLFSGQRFKQRGAFYRSPASAASVAASASTSAVAVAVAVAVDDPSARVDLTPGWQPELAGEGPSGGEDHGKDRTPPLRPSPIPSPKFKVKSKSKSKVVKIFRPNPLATLEPLPGAKPAINPQAPAVSFPAWSLTLGRELPA